VSRNKQNLAEQKMETVSCFLRKGDNAVEAEKVTSSLLRVVQPGHLPSANTSDGLFDIGRFRYSLVSALRAALSSGADRLSGFV
jgi:hypothetical protein